MPARFEGKVAVVTGGAAGYGRGIVEKLKDEGAAVVIADVSETAGRQTAAELNVSFVKADVTKREDWETILSAAIAKHGKLDIVVNNAGVCIPTKPSDTVTAEEYDLMMNVNLRALFHSVAVLVPSFISMGQKAVFVNIASTSAIRPRPGLAWYCASKAAVNGASNSLAIEYAAKGIHFNTVCPVIGLTAMSEGIGEEKRQAFASVIPLGRMCSPRDVGNAVAYLASDEADFITGVNLQVDGGRCV